MLLLFQICVKGKVSTRLCLIHLTLLSLSLLAWYLCVYTGICVYVIYFSPNLFDIKKWEFKEMNFETSRCTLLQYCPLPLTSSGEFKREINFLSNLIGGSCWWVFLLYSRAVSSCLWAQWDYFALSVDLKCSGISSSLFFSLIWMYKATKFEI